MKYVGLVYCWPCFQMLSSLTNSLMSVDRVLYLKKPLQYYLIVTPWRMFAAIVVVWVISIAISLPPLFIPFLTGYAYEVATCTIFSHSLNDATSTFTPYWYFLLLSVQNLLVQFVGCVWIIYIVRKLLRRKLLRRISLLRSRTLTNGDAQSNQRSVFNDYNKSQFRLWQLLGSFSLQKL